MWYDKFAELREQPEMLQFEGKSNYIFSDTVSGNNWEAPTLNRMISLITMKMLFDVSLWLTPTVPSLQNDIQGFSFSYAFINMQFV